MKPYETFMRDALSDYNSHDETWWDIAYWVLMNLKADDDGYIYDRLEDTLEHIDTMVFATLDDADYAWAIMKNYCHPWDDDLNMKTVYKRFVYDLLNVCAEYNSRVEEWNSGFMGVAGA